MTEGGLRPAWAEVDLDALTHNVSLLARRAAPAALFAVVKADAYGHGAVPVARAALAAGAAGLAVALVEEGVELREAGIRAPVLVLAEPAPDAMETLSATGLVATVASAGTAKSLAAVAARLGTRAPVHLKVDTGMHRVGCSPGCAQALAEAVVAEPALRLEGIFTHLAVADGTGAEDRDFTALQLGAFDEAVEAVAAGAGSRPALVHVANTAATVAWPEARRDLVRCGIGLYGLAPSDELATGEAGGFFAELRPVLSLKARVTAVRELDAGERPSYGRRRPLPARSVVATVPLGYADGVARRLFDGGCEVLVGGRRRPLAGTVTMDQVVVDCGADLPVATGDEVVLIGRQGAEEVTATEWARMLGTIGYEVLCGIGPRVPRVHVGGGVAVGGSGPRTP